MTASKPCRVDNRHCGFPTKQGKPCCAHAKMGDDGEIIGCYLHDPRREKEGSGRPCSCWFHRWITVWDIWRGEVPVFASFEHELTPLWVWEE